MEKSESSHRAGIRIQVVDDHPGTAATLARAISQLGPQVEVISARSGKEALEQMQSDYVDLLITDMMMPSMNGLELIEKMQSNPGGRPAYTILMTAYSVPGLKETARRLNVNEVLLKPFPPEQICQIIRRVIDDTGMDQPPRTASESRPPFTILIADDHSDNTSLLSRYLDNEGYKFIVAHDGVETLEKARAEMPDLVLLDVNMPRKDGLKVVQEMRADPVIEHIPVIILTAARVGASDIQYGLNLGADDYVTKPFDRRELLARIRTKLRVKETEDIIRRRNRELSVLPEIGRELSARLDLDELSELVLRRTVETLGAMAGHMIILNSGCPIQKQYRISTSGSARAETKLPPLAALLRQIEENRESILIKDTHADQRWQSPADDPVRSAVIVPLFGRQDLLGILALTHEHTNYYTLEHMLLLQAITSQASIAVENIQLYETKLHEGERLAAVLLNAADAILGFDAEGRLSLVNPAGQKLFTDHEAGVGQCLASDAGYNTLLQLMDQSRLSNASSSGEVVWLDGRVFSASVTPFQEGGCVAVLHDVTRFRELERVKNEFILTASHDLNNPITSIKGFSHLIKQAGSLNPGQDEFLNRIQSAANSVSELVKNMLDLAKMDLGTQPTCEILDVAQLMWEIADEYKPQAEAKKQILALDKTETTSKVEGDALQLRQAMRNLIGNAVKFTPEGGTINLSLVNDPNLVKIDIQDTGYGIPASDLPYIFDRFYRVRNNGHDEVEGSGLGLAIVKSIVEQHGGQISVESEQGQGSCFTCILPLIQQDSSAFVNDDLTKPDPVLTHGQSEGMK